MLIGYEHVNFAPKIWEDLKLKCVRRTVIGWKLKFIFSKIEVS